MAKVKIIFSWLMFLAIIMPLNLHALTIRDVQSTVYAGTDSSQYSGQTVTLSGVVTAVLSNGTFYMQDSAGPWSGIFVYKYSSVTLPTMAIGDSVQVTGSISEYYKKTEMTVTSSSNVQIFKTGCPLPGPVLIQTSYLPYSGSTAIAEPYESVFVEADIAVVSAAGLSGNEWEINDGTGPCRVDDFLASAATIGYTPVVGDSLLSVKGVVEYYYTFKIEPRIKGDVLSIIPRINSTIPANGNTNVPASTTIRLNFSKQMDPLSMTSDRFSINGKIASAIPFTIYYDTLQWACVLIPSANLSLNDTIHVWVSHLISDINGRTLDGNSNGVAQNDSTDDVEFTFSVISNTTRIADIQKTGPDGFASQMEGQIVTIEGIVSGPDKYFSSSTATNASWYIQDNTGGLNVYGGTKYSFVLGKRAVVTGTVTEYNGVTEVSSSAAQIAMWDWALQLVQPKTMVYNQLLGESIEGLLVSVEGTISAIPAYAGGGYNMEIRNGNAPIAVRISESSGFDLNPFSYGTRVRVTGIVSQYDKEAPYNSGYQLVPRSGTPYFYSGTAYPPDIQVLSDTIAASASGQIVSVKPNPFSPDYGQAGVIEINAPAGDHLTLRIYDLKGRLVKTCLNNVPGGHQYYYWDATDDSHRRASIGMYIAHLRTVTAEGSVSDQTKVIVLGTKLQ